jgi:hypothetical protein
MNKCYTIILSAFIFCATLSSTGFAQVNLPYTLSFTTTGSTWATTGMATSGTGGTSSINGLTVEIYAANASFNLLPGSTMEWDNNVTYFGSGDPSYTAITPGPDVTVSTDGVPAMVLKSSNPTNNFSLTSIELYDWGWTDPTEPIAIATYNNGTLVGSITYNIANASFDPVTLTQAGALTPALFNNIDEVRFYPTTILSGSGFSAPAFYLSMNNIALSDPIVLPINIVYFKATAEGNVVQVQWQTAEEKNVKDYELEYCTDGISYSSVLTTVTPQGEATNNYSYLHTTPAVGTNYYRLKIVNDDGSFSYSSIVPIDIENNSTATIYPNPATDNIVITLPNANKSVVNIYNSTGSLIKTTTVYSTTNTVDIHNLPSGTYFINVIENGTSVINKTFIKE